MVWMDQSLRALGNTMLDVGDDISDRVTQLYAPPGAWSNGFLWGADVVTIGRDRRFTPNTSAVEETDEVEGGVRPGRSDWLALEVDSRTAVRDGQRADRGRRRGAARDWSRSRPRRRHARGQHPVRRERAGPAPRGRPRGGPVVRARERPAAAARGDRAGAADRVPVLARSRTGRSRRGSGSPPTSSPTTASTRLRPIRSANYDVIYNTNQSYPADTPRERDAARPLRGVLRPRRRLRRGADQRRQLRGLDSGRLTARRPAGRVAGQALGGGQGDRGGR